MQSSWFLSRPPVPVPKQRADTECYGYRDLRRLVLRRTIPCYGLRRSTARAVQQAPTLAAPRRRARMLEVRTSQWPGIRPLASAPPASTKRHRPEIARKSKSNDVLGFKYSGQQRAAKHARMR